jgi:hypothetical protein
MCTWSSAGLLTTVARYMIHLKQVFLLLDAMGLIAFSLIGCNVALELGYPGVVVVMAGMITGISGGILRDVLCNQVPVVFRRELYASVSLAVCLLFLGLRALDVGPTSAPWCALPAGCCSGWPPSAFTGGCPRFPTSSAGTERIPVARRTAAAASARVPPSLTPLNPAPMSEPIAWLPDGTLYSPRFGTATTANSGD